jgi:hypothetical protein
MVGAAATTVGAAVLPRSTVETPLATCVTNPIRRGCMIVAGETAGARAPRSVLSVATTLPTRRRTVMVGEAAALRLPGSVRTLAGETAGARTARGVSPHRRTLALRRRTVMAGKAAALRLAGSIRTAGCVDTGS